MAIDNAKDYANSIAKTIKENCDSGYIFGYDVERVEYGESPELSAYDWLENVLDIEYRISSDREYRSAKVLITSGGPNTWVDTGLRQVICAWGSSPIAVDIPKEFCGELDLALEELFLS